MAIATRVLHFHIWIQTVGGKLLVVFSDPEYTVDILQEEQEPAIMGMRNQASSITLKIVGKQIKENSPNV